MMAAASTTPVSTSNTSLLRYLLSQQLQFALLLWAGFVLFVLAVILGVNWLRGPIEVSGWDYAFQGVPWYTLFVGVHLGWSVLPLYITHGQTRQKFARDAVGFTLVFAAGIAVLVTGTFILESGLYRAAGWPQEVTDQRMYTSASQLHLVFMQSWLVFTLWTAGGIFIASAWYRQDGLGGLALMLGIVFAGISGIAVSSDWGPFGAVYEWMFDDDAVSRLSAVVLHLACIATVLVLMWLIVRDVPVRNKND